MKISIVIPAYNAEKYIRQAVESCRVSDSEIKVEVVIVDDGSKDRTAEICKGLIKTPNCKVVFHQQKNGGASEARKTGIMLASGDYVMFCDADDTIETQNLIKFVRMAYENKVDLLVGCSHDFSSDGKVDFIQKNKLSGNIESICLVEGLLESKIIIGPACKLFHKSLVSESCFNLPRNIVFNEDLFMNIAFAKRARKILVLDNLVIYNHLTDNPNSVTHTLQQNDGQWLALFKEIKSQIIGLKDINYSAYLKFVCDRVRGSSFNHGKRFMYSKEVLALFNDMKFNNVSLRDKISLVLLAHPFLIKPYHLFFKLSRSL